MLPDILSYDLRDEHTRSVNGRRLYFSPSKSDAQKAVCCAFFSFLTVMTDILRLFIAIFEYKKITALSFKQRRFISTEIILLRAAVFSGAPSVNVILFFWNFCQLRILCRNLTEILFYCNIALSLSFCPITSGRSTLTRWTVGGCNSRPRKGVTLMTCACNIISDIMTVLNIIGLCLTIIEIVVNIIIAFKKK